MNRKSFLKTAIVAFVGLFAIKSTAKSENKLVHKNEEKWVMHTHQGVAHNKKDIEKILGQITPSSYMLEGHTEEIMIKIIANSSFIMAKAEQNRYNLSDRETYDRAIELRKMFNADIFQR